MFKLEMMPAGHGDCLWIEYGDLKTPHRVLIDGGPAPTYPRVKARIEALPPRSREFDLLIITHVDADHIEGVVRLLGDTTLGAKFGEVWFNGWKHLPDPNNDKLGPVHGEYLTALLEKGGHAWNVSFKGNAVRVPDQGTLPRVTLPGGMTLTLLSPTNQQLIKLRPKWNAEVRKAGLEPGGAAEALEHLAGNRRLQPDALGDLKVAALAAKPFASDHSEANGSSIAVLAEYGGKSCLLTGDAFAPVLVESIQRLVDERGVERLRLDAFKIAHHGSQGNLSKELLNLFRCPRYLFSTNGKIFNHPDPESVARVIMHGGKKPSLYFNYRSEENEMWDNERLWKQHDFTVFFPPKGKEGMEVDLQVP
jgi:hypothetical protein